MAHTKDDAFHMTKKQIKEVVDERRRKRKIKARMKLAKVAGHIKAKAWTPDPTWGNNP